MARTIRPDSLLGEMIEDSFEDSTVLHEDGATDHVETMLRQEQAQWNALDLDEAAAFYAFYAEEVRRTS